jgi:large repetitive protein
MRRSIAIVVSVVVIVSGCQASASPAPSASATASPAGASASPGTVPSPSVAPATPEPSAIGAPANWHWVDAGGSTIGDSPLGVQLGDGRVLVLSASLSDTPATTAQLWDPTTNEWQPTEGLNKFREVYVAVPLADGRALVTAGRNADNQSFSSTHIFDPATETWSSSGLLGTARTSASGVALKDGRVLVAGGYFNNGGPFGGVEPDVVLAAFRPNADLADVDIPPFAVAMATAELFDPATGTWSPTGPMTYARTGSAAVRLVDGRILVFGSGGGAGSGVTVDGRSHASAEIYDPATGRFSLAGTLPPLDRAALEAQGAPGANPIPTDDGEIHPGVLVALPDGGAMLIGVTFYWKHVADITRSFRYDAARNTWSEIGETWVVVGEPAAAPLFIKGVPNLAGSVAALLPDGRVIVAGGHTPSEAGAFEGAGDLYNQVSEAAQYIDPGTGAWSDAPSMPIPRAHGQSLALQDGSVFVFGGGSMTTDVDPGPSAVRFVP